jgi:hypothetical protein
LEEKFVYDSAKDAFVSHHEVYALLQEYLDETCDPILEDFLKRKMMRRQIDTILPIRVREAFGHEIVNTRGSLRRPYAENVKCPFNAKKADGWQDYSHRDAI